MAQSSKMSIAMKWGGIMAGALIFISLLFYLMGISEETGTGKIINLIMSYGISIGTMVLGISAYKKANAGNLSIGDGVVLGILIALVGGVLMALYTYIFMTYIDPSSLDAIRDEALANANTENMEADQAEMTENIMGAFISPTFICLMVVVMKFFLGLFIGLVSGLMMKNTSEEYPDLT